MKPTSIRKPFPRLTLSLRRRRNQKNPRRLLVFSSEIAMDSIGKNTTGTKTPLASRSKISKISKTCENLNPNLSSPSPGLKKMSNSLGAKSHKSFQRNKIRERKFVMAKKEEATSDVTCKCKDRGVMRRSAFVSLMRI